MDELVMLAHGSGGSAMRELVRELILAGLGERASGDLLDAAVIETEGRIAFTTDSFVISPPFFRGGDIGELAVYGTCNDLAVMGAEPRYLSLSFIVEEGFRLADLRRVVNSVREAAQVAGVVVVTGDTKVVERGKGDGIFVNTAGIGILPPHRDWRGREVRPGDLIVISGTIGDHGIAVMLDRLGIEGVEEAVSDLAPLNLIMMPLLDRFSGIVFARDPTRGGVATVLGELASERGVAVEIYEEKLPVRPWVRQAAELLGIDPLYAANEGKALLVVAPDQAHEVVAELRSRPLGREAEVIGEIKEGRGVYLRTSLGTRRILGPLRGEILPRIC